MGQVARYDVTTVRKPERTAQGFLRADAVLTRSGVFQYRNADGSIRHEYRPPEEVFKADALASFEDAPLTLDHPGRLVDASTAKKHSVGYVKEVPRRDGDHAVSRILVQDAKAIDEVESNRRRAVSCGYLCDYDPTPGVTPGGERFDGVQKNIRGNHLALVTVARAGPEASIRLDAGDAVMVTDDDPISSSTSVPTPAPTTIRKDSTMLKVRLDGVDYEVSEQAAQAINVALDNKQKRIDALEAQLTEQKDTSASQAKDHKVELDKEKARADAADEEAKKAKAEREDALKPEKLQEAVKARVDLERTAAGILGDEEKLDEMDDTAIKRAVVEKVHPEAKARLDDASEEYLNARFDAAVEAFGEQPNESLGDVRRAADNATLRTDGPTAKDKFYEDEAKAWQPSQ